jgi:hypothetical protein
MAQALASGSVQPDEHHVKRVVLLALGLFYEPALEGELKAQGHVLANLPVLEVDPREPLADWPESLRAFYKNLGREPHAGSTSPDDAICNRVTFMYGAPYAERKLVPEIHRDTWMLRFHSGSYQPELGDLLQVEASGAGATLLELELETGSWGQGDAAGTMTLEAGKGEFVAGDVLVKETNKVGKVGPAKFFAAELPNQFGSIPLRMFKHGAQNVRRGWAGRYGRPNDDFDLKGKRRAARILEGLDAVTLISGSENQLWRPQSISQMYEWLISSGVPRARERCHRHIVKGFAHQDLLWGKDAPKKIFPLILDGLRGLQGSE